MKHTHKTSKIKPNVTATYIGSIAAGTDFEHPIFVAPLPCVITDVQITTSTDITQSDTDYNTYDVQDKGSDGTGTDSIVSATTKATGGIDVNDFDATSLGTVSATHSELAADDVVSFKKTHAGAGQAAPDLTVFVTWKAR